MAERRPDLAREHRLHDRFRGPPRASPVRFQVSRPADRTSRGWARGVPLAECRFPGPATRRLGRLRRESERSTQNGRAKTLWCVYPPNRSLQNSIWIRYQTISWRPPPLGGTRLGRALLALRREGRRRAAPACAHRSSAKRWSTRAESAGDRPGLGRRKALRSEWCSAPTPSLSATTRRPWHSSSPTASSKHALHHGS